MDMKKFLEDFDAAYNEAFWAEDNDAVMTTFTHDVVFEDELFGDYLEGADAVRGMYEAVFYITDPGTNEVVDQFISSDGSRAVQILRWRGTSGSGRPFDIRTLALHEYRNGEIAKEVMFYADRDAFAKLAGWRARSADPLAGPWRPRSMALRDRA